MHSRKIVRSRTRHRMVNGKPVFYINGDSWLANSTSRVANSDHRLFKDYFVINHSVPGSGNISIINRTRTALADLEKYNIKPVVCIGLSEVGRDLNEEFKLCRPEVDLSNYLRSVLLQEFSLLQGMLQNYDHYLCTGWVSNPFGTKSIIDFIDQDFTELPKVYSVGNGVYNWLDSRSDVLKFSKESFVDAVNDKQLYQSVLLKNQYINKELHLERIKSDLVYERFFEHVLSLIGRKRDN